MVFCFGHFHFSEHEKLQCPQPAKAYNKRVAVTIFKSLLQHILFQSYYQSPVNFYIYIFIFMAYSKKELIFLEEAMELNIKGASKGQILKKLFLSTLYLSAFTFGGGYVIVTLMKTKFVDQYHWIDEEEMLDLVAIAQSCPGAIAVNGAIVVGYKLAGLTGVLCSVVATVIPPFVILSAISFCYAAFRSNLIVGWMLNGMQSGVGAVIMEVSFSMASGIVKEKQYLSIFIMIVAFIANYFYKVSAIVLILLCIALGVVLTLYREKKAKKNDCNTSQSNEQKGGTL